MLVLLLTHGFKWDKNTPSLCCSFPFLSPFSLYCNVVVLVVVCVFFLPLWLHSDWDVSYCVCPNRSSFFLCLPADWPRSPLAHGCRSTHNSPVHSACSSQRLSQNFSVSVPTLIFTGMQRQERK